jgi:hypothetical protein
MLGVLEAILREAVEARDRGKLVIETMGAIAERATLHASTAIPRSASETLRVPDA